MLVIVATALVAWALAAVTLSLPKLIDVLLPRGPINYGELQTNNLVKLHFHLTNLRFKIASLLYYSHFPEQNAGKVDKIYVYPIKSIGYLLVQSWPINQHGLQYDRQFAIGWYSEIRGVYNIITQRECPKLSMVKLDYFVDEGARQDWFRVHYMDDMSRSFDVPGNVTDEYLRRHSSETSMGKESTTSVLWKNKFSTIEFNENFLPRSFLDWSGITGKYLSSKNQNEPLHKVRFLYSRTGKFVKVGSPKEWNDKYRVSLFHDYYPLHIVAQEDLDWLNEKINSSTNQAEQTQPKNEDECQPIEGLNFRGNLVLKNTRGPFDIDTIAQFYLTSPSSKNKNQTAHKFKTTTKCQRCVIPNINHLTGKIRRGTPVTRALNKFRKIDSGSPGPVFGIYAIYYDDGGWRINVGDVVLVAERRVNVFEAIEPKRENKGK